MLTKGAIGNLINRYRAVLKKCNLINAFGSFAVAAMLVMGGAGVAVAAKPNLTALDAITIYQENYPHGVDDYIYGARLDAQMEIATPLGWSVGLGSDSYELKLNNKDMVDQLLLGGRYAGVSVDRYKDASKYVYSDVDTVTIRMNPGAEVQGEFNGGGLAIGGVIVNDDNQIKVSGDPDIENPHKLTFVGKDTSGKTYHSHVEKSVIIVNGGTLKPLPGNQIEDGYTKIRGGGVSHNGAFATVDTAEITIKGGGGNSIPTLLYTSIYGGGCNGGWYEGTFDNAEKIGGYVDDQNNKIWYNQTRAATINIENMAYSKDILEKVMNPSKFTNEEKAWLGNTIFAGGDNSYVKKSTINIKNSTVGTVFAGGESFGVTDKTDINLQNSAILDFYSGAKLESSKEVGIAHKTIHDKMVGRVRVTMKNSSLFTWSDQIFVRAAKENGVLQDIPNGLKQWLGPDGEKKYSWEDTDSNGNVIGSGESFYGIKLNNEGGDNYIYLKDAEFTKKYADHAAERLMRDGLNIKLVMTGKRVSAIGENPDAMIFSSTEPDERSTGDVSYIGNSAYISAGTSEVVDSQLVLKDSATLHLTGTAAVNEYFLNSNQYESTDAFVNTGYATEELLSTKDGSDNVAVTVKDNATLRLGSPELSGGKLSSKVELEGSGALEVIGGNFTLANVQANANSVITVGNSNSAATLTLGAETMLNGATVFLDPAWTGIPERDVLENASHLVRALPDGSSAIDANYIIGQNSVLTLTDTSTSAEAAKQKTYDNFNALAESTGISWGPDGITAALSLLSPCSIESGYSITVDGERTEVPADSSARTGSGGDATFAPGSLLLIDEAALSEFTPALSGKGKLTVEDGAKIYLPDAELGESFKIAKFEQTDTQGSGWDGDNVLVTHLINGTLSRDENGNLIITTTEADMGDYLPINALDAVRRAGNSSSLGTGGDFLKKATSHSVLSKAESVAVINEVARASVTAGVQNTALRISDTASNVVLDHMSLNQHDGSRSIHADGVDFWAAPMYGNLYTSGMTVSGDSVRGQFGGLALGADMEASNILGGKFRLGAAINGGGGKSEAKGTVSNVQNDYGFGGLSLYTGWNRGAFNVIGSVGYSMSDHEVEMHMPASMDMGKAKADVDTSAVTADLRAEYQLKTAYVDILPHVGVRYTALRTDSHDLKVNGSALNSFESDTQHIVQFPVGVTLSKDFSFADWNVKPSFDVSVIPAAGDKKNSTTVRFSGVNAVDSFESRVMDSTSWTGAIGVQAEKGNMSFGLNYGVQASSHETDQNVQLKLGWKF